MYHIYHLLLPSSWSKALGEGTYSHPSFKQEGFIHFSTEAQLLDSANRYFPEDEELWAIGIPVEKAGKLLRWERSRDGQDFPHLYRRIQTTEVEELLVLKRHDSGQWESYKKSKPR